MRTADWTDSVSVLDRVTAVLDAFGDDDGLGVSELARRANLPKSTVSRIVTDLVRQRYLDREGSRLHLGLKLFELGQSVERPMHLRRIAHPVMVQLRNLTGASVRLAVLDGEDVVVIASLGGGDDDGRGAGPGSRIPALASALGLAILANSPDEELHAAKELHAATITGAQALRAELVGVRRAGVASVDDPAMGTTSVASPILAIGGAPIGAISVEGPASAIDARRVGGLVRSAATTLGRRWMQHGHV